MLGFLLRFVVLETVAAIGALVSNAIVTAGPHWSGSDGARLARWVAFIVVLSAPGSVLMAAAAREADETAVAAVFTFAVLCACGYLAGSTSSSTAGLIYLWIPFIGIPTGVVGLLIRAWLDRR